MAESTDNRGNLKIDPTAKSRVLDLVEVVRKATGKKPNQTAVVVAAMNALERSVKAGELGPDFMLDTPSGVVLGESKSSGAVGPQDPHSGIVLDMPKGAGKAHALRQVLRLRESLKAEEKILAALQKALADVKSWPPEVHAVLDKPAETMKESLLEITKHAEEVAGLFENLKGARVRTQGKKKDGKPIDVLAIAAEGKRLAEEILAGVARIDSRPAENTRRSGVSAKPAGGDGQQDGDADRQASTGTQANG